MLLPTNIYVDTHTHIDQYPDNELPGILARARNEGVGLIVAAGVCLSSSQRCIELAAQEELVVAAVGVHPQEIKAANAHRDLDKISHSINDSNVVAISEVGLDYQPDSPAKEVQIELFTEQCRMAIKAGLPVIFHNREATTDTLRVLRSTYATGNRQPSWGAHYFQGDWSYATALMDLGCMLSLAKPLLRLPELQEVVKRIPLEFITLETDSYPQPFKKNRSKWTEPRDIPLIAQCLAQLKGVSERQIMKQTTANALGMLRISRHTSTPSDTDSQSCTESKSTKESSAT